VADEHHHMLAQIYSGPCMHRSIVPKGQAAGCKPVSIDAQKLD
jgi:hypothetical protein